MYLVARSPTEFQFARAFDFFPIPSANIRLTPDPVLSCLAEGRRKSIAAISHGSVLDPPTPPEDDALLRSRLCSITSLSSADSGGDYSCSDHSEPGDQQEHVSGMLPKPIMVTIDLITRKVESILNRAVYIQRTRGKSSKSNSGTAPNSRRPSIQGLQASSGKRKARGGDDGGFPEDDEDGAIKRRRVSVTTNEDSETGPRFACPFFKHDPGRYRSRRTCPGPGWPTVHRMK